jgi:hypothetical protein
MVYIVEPVAKDSLEYFLAQPEPANAHYYLCTCFVHFTTFCVLVCTCLHIHVHHVHCVQSCTSNMHEKHPAISVASHQSMWEISNAEKSMLKTIWNNHHKQKLK